MIKDLIVELSITILAFYLSEMIKKKLRRDEQIKEESE